MMHIDIPCGDIGFALKDPYSHVNPFSILITVVTA